MNDKIKQFYDRAPIWAQNGLVSLFAVKLQVERYGGQFARFRDMMLESESWSAPDMARWQDERLRTLILHCYEYVPYYRELFDLHGIDPHRFRGREDLEAIPILTRETVKTRAADLRSRHPSHRSLAEGHTSGTTGSPLTLHYDKAMMAMSYAALDRQYRWAGARLGFLGDRIAVLRGNIIVPLSQKSAPFWRHNFVHNQLLLSNFHLSTNTAPQYFDALVSFRPSVLDGYPSSVYALARLFSRHSLAIQLDAVLTSSETLYDFQRQAIEETFRCRVFDYFGAAERVIFSAECDHHEGHHLFQEYGVTEIVNEDGHSVAGGKTGFLVGTTLHNLGFPLIRYATSDLSQYLARRCACGRTLPLVSDVTTKAEDMLRLRDGRLISPSVLTHPFKPLDSIEESQLVQTSLDHLLVRIVPRPTFTGADADRLLRDLKDRLGSDMIVSIETVQTLPRTSAGKFKWVISNVDAAL